MQVLDDATFEAWDKTLSSASKQKSKGRTAGVSYISDSTVESLFELATELRDRLRFSEMRTAQLKHDLRSTQSTLASEQRQAQERLEVERLQSQTTLMRERDQARDQAERDRQASEDMVNQEREMAVSGLSALEEQIVGLTTAVQAQADAVSEQEQTNLDLQAALSEARQKVASLTVQVDQCMSRAEKAEDNRDVMMDKIHELSALLDDARNSATHHETRHGELLSTLESTKTRASELNHLQGLYLSAREELDRLDKENAELKEMMQSNMYSLTKSRILETLSSSHKQQEKSVPLFLTPEMTGRSRSTVRGRSAATGRRRSGSPGRDSVLAATGVIYPPETVADAIGSLTASLRGTSKDGAMMLADAAKLASMAFLGPPASAYPTDPDKFVFVRVAGGFSPKYVGSDPLPKASGWVPKDVVRLVQSFKHSYGVKVEWRCWEPLLLMIDEVYRLGKVPPSGQKAQMAAKELEERIMQQTGTDVRRYAGPGTATYPSVVQAGRIVQLRKELARTQRQHTKAGGEGPYLQSLRQQREQEFFTRSMAEKDYHVVSQLGEAITENQRLRHSLTRLEEELYQREP